MGMEATWLSIRSHRRLSWWQNSGEKQAPAVMMRPLAKSLITAYSLPTPLAPTMSWRRVVSGLKIAGLTLLWPQTSDLPAAPSRRL